MFCLLNTGTKTFMQNSKSQDIVHTIKGDCTISSLMYMVTLKVFGRQGGCSQCTLTTCFCTCHCEGDCF